MFTRSKQNRNWDISVLLLSISGDTFHCIMQYPNQEPQVLTTKIANGMFYDNGHTSDISALKTHLSKIVQRVGKADVGIALIPSKATQLGYYRLSKAAATQDEITRLAVADSKFIVREEGRGFESEPVVVLYETFEDDDAQNVHVVVNMFPQRLVDLYQQLFESVEIPLAVIDTMDFVLLRCLYDKYADDIANSTLLFALPDDVLLIALSDGVPIFRRFLPYTISQVKDSVEVQRLADEVQNTINYIQARNGITGIADRFYVLSPTEHLQQELSSRGDTAKNISYDLYEDYPQSVANLDNFLFYATIRSYTDNFGEYFRDVATFEVTPAKQKKELVRSLAQAFPFAVALAGLLIAGSTGWIYLKRASLQEAIMTYEERVALLEQRLSRSREVRELERRAETGLSAYETVQSMDYDYAQYIQFIMETLPDDIVLQDINFKGRVWTSKVVGKTLHAITNYLVFLSRTPEISGVDYAKVEATEDGYVVELTAVFSSKGVSR